MKTQKDPNVPENVTANVDFFSFAFPPTCLPCSLSCLLCFRYKLAVTKMKDKELSSTCIYNQNDPWNPLVAFANFIDNETIMNEVRACGFLTTVGHWKDIIGSKKKAGNGHNANQHVRVPIPSPNTQTGGGEVQRGRNCG